MTSQSQVAIITGGGTGVGAATARLLSRRGFDVAINYSRSAEAAEAVADDCRRQGRRAIALQGDVSIDADCRRMVDTTARELGGVSLLVNSAATTQVTTFTDVDAQNADDLLKVYSVNVVGAYQMARAAAPHLKASGRGSIVGISSLAGQIGAGSSIAYTLSKGALNTLTLVLARLYAPGVRANTVVPGVIDTEWFTSKGVPQADVAQLKQRFGNSSALGTICTPEDVASAVVYVGVDATKMTGQSLVVDGGYLLGKSPRV